MLHLVYALLCIISYFFFGINSRGKYVDARVMLDEKEIFPFFFFFASKKEKSSLDLVGASCARRVLSRDDKPICTPPPYVPPTRNLRKLG